MMADELKYESLFTLKRRRGFGYGTNNLRFSHIRAFSLQDNWNRCGAYVAFGNKPQ